MSNLNMYPELSARECGVKSFENGFNIIDNPFDRNTPNWQSWIDGFNFIRAKEARRDGYKALLDDLSESDNPYHSDQFEYQYWREGFGDACFDL